MTALFRPFLGQAMIGTVILVLFTLAAVFFAGQQAVWIDETTQLFGLTLPPLQQLEWLSGARQIVSGVPPDRAVPMSYWLGWIWAEVFGLGEMQMRLFGIVSMLSGAPAIWLAGRRLAGAWGALFALAVIYLAPGMIVQAGEIRSYPLFFAFSAWAIWAFVEVLERPSASCRHLVLLVLFLTLANYTHFFGLLLSGFLGLTLIAAFLIERRPIAPVLLAAGIALLLSAGLLPFLTGALAVTDRGTEIAASGASLRETLRDTAKLIFRLALHGSAFAVMPVAALALLSLAALAVLALIRQAAPRLRSRGLYLLMPLALALGILPVLKLRISGFDVLAPHYNLWMVPVAMLFLAGAFRNGPRLWNVLPAATLVATHLVTTCILLRHASAYSHGPGEWVAGLVEVPEKTLIVHDAEGAWAQAYFPAYALTGGRVTQVLHLASGAYQRIMPTGLEDLLDGPDFAAFAQILLVRTRTMSSLDIAAHLGKEDQCGIPPMEVPAPLASAPSQQDTYCALAGAFVIDIRPGP